MSDEEYCMNAETNGMIDSDAKRWILVAILAIVGIGVTAAAPIGLRRVDAFRIDRVEVVGAHYMTAEQVLKASRITTEASVFDDVERWRTALLRHPLIATASVQRRLPNTTVIRITETKPVAFARTPELRPVDARGRVLPADPTMVDMDLPIIEGDARIDARGQIIDLAIARTAAVLGRLQELEPVLAPWVSEATPLKDGVRLSLRGPANAEVLLPFDIDQARLRELRVTLADLATPAAATAASGASPAIGGVAAPVTNAGLRRVTRIDVRFREQVVVSLHTTGIQ
ncbi:MAG: FtsQ-type POTRA domain-containing protein [Longimicrobiales bacterium]